jgi:hypothetical protein
MQEMLAGVRCHTQPPRTRQFLIAVHDAEAAVQELKEENDATSSATLRELWKVREAGGTVSSTKIPWAPRCFFDQAEDGDDALSTSFSLTRLAEFP